MTLAVLELRFFSRTSLGTIAHDGQTTASFEAGVDVGGHARPAAELRIPSTRHGNVLKRAMLRAGALNLGLLLRRFAWARQEDCC
jgi:hypothetical protein